MKTLYFIGILLAVLCHLKACVSRCPANNHLSWSYDGPRNGPRKWGKIFPQCNGYMQSPIAIISSNACTCLRPLKTSNYNMPIRRAEIYNKGTSVLVYPKDDVIRAIEVDKEYRELAFFDMHWGRRANQGSEHSIDGKKYALEVQFWHFTSQSNRIDILSVLYQEQVQNNTAFQPIIDALSSISFEHQSSALATDLQLVDIVPAYPIPVFQYEGSETVPSCRESVKWSIAKEIKPIGKHQMTELRKLHSVPDVNNGGPWYNLYCKISGNFRPLQPLNGRKVLGPTN